MTGPRGRRILRDQRPWLGMATGDAGTVTHHARGARAVHRRRSAAVRTSGHDVVDRCRRYVPRGWSVARGREPGRCAVPRTGWCVARPVERKAVRLPAVVSVPGQPVVRKPVVTGDARRRAARRPSVQGLTDRHLAVRDRTAARASIRRPEFRRHAVIAVTTGTVRTAEAVGPGTVRLVAVRRVGHAVATGRAVRPRLAVPSRGAVGDRRGAVPRQVPTGLDRPLTRPADVLPTSTLGGHTVARVRCVRGLRAVARRIPVLRRCSVTGTVARRLVELGCLVAASGPPSGPQLAVVGHALLTVVCLHLIAARPDRPPRGVVSADSTSGRPGFARGVGDNHEDEATAPPLDSRERKYLRMLRGSRASP